ncbi:MAG: NfeD family protein [Pseudomonadota bacterium]
MDVIASFLLDMPFWAWFVIAAFFLLGEVITGTTFLLWPAIAALLMGLITIVQLDGQWVTQWILFAILTVALGIVGKPYAERWINQSSSDRPNLNEAGQLKVGKRGRAATTFSSGQGRVVLGDTQWSARAVDDTVAVAEGDEIEVVSMEGTVVIVKRL